MKGGFPRSLIKKEYGNGELVEGKKNVVMEKNSRDLKKNLGDL